MDVLVLAAHPDDEVLGCGATLIKWVREGHQVFVAFAGKGRPRGSQAADAQTVAKLGGWQIVEQGDFPDQQYDCIGVLKISQWAENILDKVCPNRVLIHSIYDRNQDHVTLARASQVTCRTRADVWVFPVPGSIQVGFDPVLFVELNERLWSSKRICVQHYSSELRLPPHPRSLAVIEAQARVYGAMAGCELAEGFSLERLVI